MTPEDTSGGTVAQFIRWKLSIGMDVREDEDRGVQARLTSLHNAIKSLRSIADGYAPRSLRPNLQSLPEVLPEQEERMYRRMLAMDAILCTARAGVIEQAQTAAGPRVLAAQAHAKELKAQAQYAEYVALHFVDSRTKRKPAGYADQYRRWVASLQDNASRAESDVPSLDGAVDLELRDRIQRAIAEAVAPFEAVLAQRAAESASRATEAAEIIRVQTVIAAAARAREEQEAAERARREQEAAEERARKEREAAVVRDSQKYEVEIASFLIAARRPARK